MKPKKKTRKKRGHRQEITRLMIDSITLNGEVFVAQGEAEKETPILDETPAEEVETAAE
jgi:large subunit ribosomal protein L21